jgi:hypothetical protein
MPQNKTKQNKTKQNKTKQNKTKQNKKRPKNLVLLSVLSNKIIRRPVAVLYNT